MRGEFGQTIENEPEKSSIKKIVGDVEKEKKEEIKKEFAKIFNEQKFECLKKKEIEKTAEQIETIKFINDETNKLLEKYGLPKFNISSDNVHILEEKDYKPEAGWYMPYYQSVFLYINRIPKEFRNSNLSFANFIFHKFIHFKSFQSIRYLESQKRKTIADKTDRAQTGLRFQKKSGDVIFDNLNEGITEELTKKFHKDILEKHPLFSKKIEENKKILKETEAEGKIDKSIIDDVYDIEEAEGMNHGMIYMYLQQRKVLNNLIEKLYSKNTDKFENKEEVFDLFAKSVFTGKLNWGKLVNRTFGKGTFKKLAQVDENVDKLEKFVSNLK